MRRLVALAWAVILVLAPPPAAAQDAHTVRFEFLADRQILFPISINGRPAEAWLDSGSSATVVDAAFARELGLELGDPISARGVAGQVAGVRLARADVKIGDAVIPARRVAVMDLTALRAVTPRPVQVILGREVFQDAVLEIDFASRRIAISPQDRFQPPRARPLPLRRSGLLKSFPIRVGGVRTEAILDLGNSGALLLDYDFAARRGLLSGRRTSTQLSVGADGPRTSLVTSLDRVQVGGVTFNGVTAVATEGLTSHAPANVGLEILSRFHVTVDFAGGRLWLQPIRGAVGAPFRKNRAGIAVVADADRIRITHVAPGSPAEAAGWRIGEAIVAVDGEPVGVGYAGSELSRWIYRPAGTVVTLTMLDGTRRALTLADYF